MMVTIDDVQHCLRMFTTEAMKKIVPMVMDVSWSQVETVLMKNKLPLQKNYIVQVVVKLYKDMKPVKEDLEILVRKLKFFGVVNSANVVWSCAKLQNRVSSLLSSDELESNLINSCKQDGMSVDVLIYEEDPLIFTMVHDRKYKKSLIYFVFHTALPDEQYFFYYTSLNKNNNKINKNFCEALGYESHSSVQLSGRDVRKLFQMIKKSQETNLEVIPIFDPVRVVEGDGVIDFTLGRERSKYAEQIFQGLTNFNHFTVHAKSTWKGDHDISTDGNERFLTALTFSVTQKGHSVEYMLKELLKAGVLKLPLPNYIANMTTVPRNNISLQEDHDSDQYV